MNKIIVILGFAGKGTLELSDYLEYNYGYKRIKPYTTKPPSRIDYMDYNFVSTTEFNRREKKGEFEMVRTLTIPGAGDYTYIEKKYAFSKKDLDEGGLTFLNWDGYTDLLNNHSNTVALLLQVDLDKIYNPDFDEYSSEDVTAKSLRDRFLIKENKILLNEEFIDSMALIYKIYKINAGIPFEDIQEIVDSILKEN